MLHVGSFSYSIVPLRLNRHCSPVHWSHTPFVKDSSKRCSCGNSQKLSYYITSFKEVWNLVPESSGNHRSHGSVPPFLNSHMPAIFSFCAVFNPLHPALIHWLRNLEVCQSQTFITCFRRIDSLLLGLPTSSCLMLCKSPFTYLRPAKPPAAVTQYFPWGSPPLRLTYVQIVPMKVKP